MDADRRKQFVSIGVIAIVAGLGGLGLWQFGGANRDFLANQRQAAQQQRAAAGLSDEDAKRLIEWAERYVLAVQRRDCEQVIAMTIWMQDRLEYVRSHGDDERAAHDALCNDVHNPPAAGRFLSDGGADDAALFSPLAQVDVVSVDPGRDDLETASAGRVWVRVRYPSPAEALHDAEGRAIKTARAGLTFAADGRLVKAGIVGNAELDDESEVVYW